MWILFAIVTASIIALGISMVVLILRRNVRTAQGATMQGKYPQGHWMGVGMCIGMALGLISSLAALRLDEMTAFIGIGPAIGVSIGVAIGSALEQKYKDKVRPLTEQEQKMRKWATLIGLVLAALGILALVGALMLTSMR